MTFSNEFWAAIAGAIVGGLIAAVMQLLSVWLAAKERKRSELFVRQSQARSLLFKVVKIYSDFKTIHDHVEECRQRAEANGASFGWLWLVALANLPKPIVFSADEMGTLLACKDNDLFNDIAALDDVHNGLVETLKLYRDRRTALSDSLPAQMQGMVGTILVDPATRQHIAPKAAELEQMARDLATSFQSNVDPDFSVAKRLTEAFNKTYSLGITIIPKVGDEGEEGEERAG